MDFFLSATVSLFSVFGRPPTAPSPATPTPLERLVRAQMRGNDETSGEPHHRDRAG